jgi:hypothetical protein
VADLENEIKAESSETNDATDIKDEPECLPAKFPAIKKDHVTSELYRCVFDCIAYFMANCFSNFTFRYSLFVFDLFD